MRRSKAIAALAAVTAAMLALSACGSGGSNGGQSDQQDSKPKDIGAADDTLKRHEVPDLGDLAISVEEGMHDFNNNVGATNNFGNSRILTLVLPSPFVDDYVGGKVVTKMDGDLLESTKVLSTNPQKVEYKIRKEAVWSDGTPISCKDFYLIWLASASKATKPGEEGKPVSIWDSSPTGYDQISSLECADGGKTVTTSYSAPFADWRSLFSKPGNTFLMPAHILEKQAGVPDITKITVDQNDDTVRKAAKFYAEDWRSYKKETALSGGPYIIDSWEDNVQTTLVRNPKWWGAKPGPSKIVIRQNKDVQSAAQQLQNKEVKLIENQPDNAVVQLLRGNDSIKVFVQGGQTYEHIDFNMTRPLFKENKDLRQAIAQCVNRTELVNKLVKDVDPNAKPLGNFMFMPNEVGYEDHYTNIGKGAEEAKKILEAGGWKMGADGIYAKGQFRASFKLGHKVLDRRASTVRLAQATCRQAGIDIQSDQSEDFNAKRLPAGDFDAALFAWVGTPVKSNAYGNYAAKDRGGASNYAGYDSKAMEDKWQEANRELDYNKRIKLLNEVDKIIAEDMFSIPLFQLPDFVGYDSSLSPIAYVGADGGATFNAWGWQSKK